MAYCVWSTSFYWKEWYKEEGEPHVFPFEADVTTSTQGACCSISVQSYAPVAYSRYKEKVLHPIYHLIYYI